MNHKISGILNVLFHLIFIIQLILLSGCGKEPNDWEIEYDEYIPGFHGESVRFNKPMVYVLINSHDKDYIPIQIKIGKKLTAKRTLRAYKKEIDSMNLNNDELFVITSSFWVRKDWWSNIFSPDWHIVIFKDSNGIESYSMTNIFKLYSNKPEFDTYSNFAQ